VPANGVLTDVWGTSASDVFVLGSGAVASGNTAILHFDGVSWAVTDSGVSGFLTRLGGSGPSDVWAVGGNGTATHWDGSRWTPRATGSLANLGSIVAFSPSDAWMTLGGPSQLLHWDGTAFSVRDAVPSTGARGIFWAWGFGPSDMYAGNSNTVLHFDGVSWSVAQTLAAANIVDAWGTSKDDMYFVGSQIVHYHGGVWDVGAGVPGGLVRVWGTGGNDLYAAGSFGIERSLGDKWVHTQPIPIVSYILSVWGGGSRDMWSVVNGILYRSDGSDWVSLGSASGSNLFHAMAVSESQVFTGANMSVYRSTTGTWSSSAVWATALAVRGPSDVFAAGGGGWYHWDGTSWSPFAGAGTQVPLAIWADGGSGDIWSAGVNGDLYRNVNGVITSLGKPAFSHLRALGGIANGAVFAVGDTSALRMVGSTVTDISSPQTTALRGVWAASATSAYAVGGSGKILHFDGTSWMTMNSGVQAELVSISGLADDDVFAVGYAGSEGAIVHYDGVDWTEVRAPAVEGLLSVSVQPDAVYVMSYTGVVTKLLRLPKGP